jgi:acetyl esterase/lipase
VGNHLKKNFLRPLGRRSFIGSLIASFLGVVTTLKGGFVTSSEVKTPDSKISGLDFTLPGKLGNPNLTLLEDPRLDPRIRDSYLKIPLFSTPPPSISINPTYEEAIALVEWMDKAMDSREVLGEESMPSFSDITSSKEIIQDKQGRKIELYLDRPKKSDGPIPCIVHFHGGGMSFSSANNPYTVRWRKSLAQQDALVIGVEFATQTLHEGNHPFPAGLNDCAESVIWAHKNRSKLGISSIVITGESGGGNLVLATAIKANKEGWIDAIDGVYSLAPMIIGIYSPELPPNLASYRENIDYVGNLPLLRNMTKVYDPDDMYGENSLAWPFFAQESELRGLPPHIIVNYELDLIRDDGVVFAQKLRAAGVEATSIVVNGADHVPEIAMPDTIPELTRDRLISIAEFARGVQSQR